MANLIISDEIAARLRTLALRTDQSLDDLLRDLLDLYESTHHAAPQRPDLNRLIADALDDDNMEKPVARVPSDAHYRRKYDDDPDYFT